MAEAVFGLVGVLVGSGLLLLYSYYRDRREREEKYRVMTYEKRLEIHQRAFYLIRELNKSFPGSPEYMDKDRILIIEKARAEVDEWWASNCFYLDEESQGQILYVIGLSEELVHDYGLPNDSSDEWDEYKRKRWVNTRRELTSYISATRGALAKGIGMKHIEKPQKEQPESNP